MDLYVEAINSLFIPQVVAALIGGVIGAMISIKVERFGWRLSILFGIGSIICAGAIAEYLYYTYHWQFILVHCGLGILVGIVGNAALDALNLAAPEFTSKIVRGTGEGLLYKIKKYLPNGNKGE